MPQLNYQREIADLRPGSHLLFLYASEEEHRQWLTPFLVEGLERGERVQYLHGQHSPETICDYLRAAGADPEAAVTQGQLVMTDAKRLLCPRGRFEPGGFLELLALETDRAVEQDYTALRVTCEMGCLIERPANAVKLMEFECKCNSLLGDSLFIGMCQYDRRRFTPAQLLEALAAHPEIVSRQGRHRNLFFSTPRHLHGECSATELLEQRLEMFATRSRAFRRLEEELEATTHVLDAVDAMVAVLDRQGRVLFLNRSWEEAWAQHVSRRRGRPLWEMAAEEQERKALQDLLDPEREGDFPRTYTGRLALNGAQGRQVVCSARLLGGTGADGRIVLTAREG